VIGFRRPRNGTILPLLLCLCWVGCSRPGSDQGTADAGQHQVPFREGGESQTADLSPTSSTSVAENGLDQGGGVPFRDPQSLPAGTLLTVRLKGPISSDSSGASRTFAAIGSARSQRRRPGGVGAPFHHESQPGLPAPEPRYAGHWWAGPAYPNLQSFRSRKDRRIPSPRNIRRGRR